MSGNFGFEDDELNSIAPSNQKSLIKLGGASLGDQSSSYGYHKNNAFNQPSIAIDTAVSS